MEDKEVDAVGRSGAANSRRSLWGNKEPIHRGTDRILSWSCRSHQGEIV